MSNEIIYTHELLHWKSKIQKSKKDGLLLLYSPADNAWRLHEFDYGVNKVVERTINSEVKDLLSKIKSNKISKSITDEVATLLLEDSFLKFKKSMWEELRTYFFYCKVMTWNELYQSILERVELKIQTRLARNKSSVNTT